MLLNLLTQISSKDYFDFGPDAVSFASDAAFHGILLILPHLSLRALQFPAVCITFYNLLKDLIGTYPDKFMNLHGAAQTSLLQAIEFALDSAQSNICRAGLQVLKALADFASDATNPTHPHPHPHPHPQSSGSHGTASVSKSNLVQALLPFQRKLVHMLLFGHMEMALLDPVSDALFPLIQCHEDAFVALVMQFLSGQSDEDMRRRVREAFENLAIGSNGTAVHSTPNRFRFRDVTRYFVEDLRAYLATK